MKRKRLADLTNELLSRNKKCSVSMDVWAPTILDIKHILKLGYDGIDPNNSLESCTIYTILFDKYVPAKAPAFRVTLFCDEVGAKFMRKYMKQRKEVNKE